LWADIDVSENPAAIQPSIPVAPIVSSEYITDIITNQLIDPLKMLYLGTTLTSQIAFAKKWGADFILEMLTLVRDSFPSHLLYKKV
jgi:hypothetical protein